MNIWYIHGAGASERSFVWLQQQLGDFTPQFFSYPLHEPMVSVIERLTIAIETDGRPALLLGHSLGGIAAVACAMVPHVERVITICTPFGGVRHADILSMFNRHPLFNDLRSYSPMLTSVRSMRIDKPHMAIVGSHGLPFISESNDGAVTVASQTALVGAQYHVVPLNHFEVLLSQEVVDLIRGFI